MFVPAHALASFEAFLQLILCLNRAHRRLKRTWQKCRTVIVRQRECPLFRQVKFSGRCVITRIAARRLAAQPLSDVTFRCLGSFGKFRGV